MAFLIKSSLNLTPFDGFANGNDVAGPVFFGTDSPLTLFVLNITTRKIVKFRYTVGASPTADTFVEYSLHENNQNPVSIRAEGTSLYVSDIQNKESIFEYNQNGGFRGRTIRDIDFLYRDYGFDTQMRAFYLLDSTDQMVRKLLEDQTISGVSRVIRKSDTEGTLIIGGVSVIDITIGEESLTLNEVKPKNLPSNYNKKLNPYYGISYQGRHFYAKFPDGKRNYILASKSNAVDDFDIGRGNDGDAIEMILPNDEEILWISGFTDIILGTDSGEYIISSSTGILTPANRQLRQQSGYGTRSVVPIVIGNRLVYTAVDGRSVRSMRYRFQESGWFSEDMSITGRYHHDVSFLAKWSGFGQGSDGILLISSENSTIIRTMIYRFENGEMTAGWGNISLPKGVMVLHLEGSFKENTNLYGVFKSITGRTVLCRYDPDVYLDLFTKQNEIFYLQVPDHFSHFESEVGVYINGHLFKKGTYDELTSINGTRISIHDEVLWGIAYKSEMETLPPIIQEAGGWITTKGFSTRWNKVGVDLSESGFPLINGSETGVRDIISGEERGIANRLLNASTSGWDKEGKIVITEEGIAPLNIIGIYGELTQENV